MNVLLQNGIMIAFITVSIMSCREEGAVATTPPTLASPPNIESPPSAGTNGMSTNGTIEEKVPDPPPPLSFSPPSAIGLEQGWASIDERADSAQRAWIEGTVKRSDKIIIDTNNVRRFTLELPHLRVNWRKRIALRIDGSTSELTKKRWPSITLERTPSGAWVAVK